MALSSRHDDLYALFAALPRSGCLQLRRPVATSRWSLRPPEHMAPRGARTRI